jgi:hypothetical protein
MLETTINKGFFEDLVLFGVAGFCTEKQYLFAFGRQGPEVRILSPRPVFLLNIFLIQLDKLVRSGHLPHSCYTQAQHDWRELIQIHKNILQAYPLIQ